MRALFRVLLVKLAAPNPQLQELVDILKQKGHDADETGTD
jgi:signal recognition particle subunit SEC65